MALFGWARGVARVRDGAQEATGGAIMLLRHKRPQEASGERPLPLEERFGSQRRWMSLDEIVEGTRTVLLHDSSRRGLARENY